MENNEIKYGQMDFNLPHDIVKLPSDFKYAHSNFPLNISWNTARISIVEIELDGGRALINSSDFRKLSKSPGGIWFVLD